MKIPEDSSQELHQIYFYGSHSDMGGDIPGTGNVDYPIAACLQHLKNAIPNYSFNERALQRRFPSYNAHRNGRNSRRLTPHFLEHKRTDRGIVRLLGTAVRSIGSPPPRGFKYNEEVCLSVRMREQHTGIAAIPGFRWVKDGDRVFWVNEEGSTAIPESEGGEFMGRLVGFPATSQ
jgi:hypothetical protein